MSKTKILLPTFILSVASLYSGLASEVANYKGHLSVKVIQLQQVGDSVFSRLAIEQQNFSLSKSESLILEPVIVKGDSIFKMPELHFYGKDAIKLQLRKELFGQKPENVGYVFNSNDQSTQTLYYQASFLFEEWMENASLVLRKQDCSCNVTSLLGEEELSRIVQPAPLLDEFVFTPHINYITPQEEVVKNRAEVKSANIVFPVGNAELVTTLSSNASLLEDINEMCLGVLSDADISVDSIRVTGYASPEGSEATNIALAGQRAIAIAQYFNGLDNRYRGKLEAASAGENWADLIPLVEKSTIKEKEKILNIIKNTPIKSGREGLIMRLDGGHPWRYMLKEYFPLLRKVEIKVHYNVKPFEVETAKILVQTTPQKLSLYELFLVANEYEPVSPLFNEILQKAAALYPDSDIANINAAGASLAYQDFERAHQYLLKVTDSTSYPEYYNLKGLLHFFEQQFSQAYIALKTAESMGNSSAKLNLKELEKAEQKRDYSKQKR